MAYRLSVVNPMHKAGLYQIDKEPYFVQWFEKSWDNLDQGGVSQAIYEEEYNVKLIFETRVSTVSAVEFPNEADAVMFVLRWS